MKMDTKHEQLQTLSTAHTNTFKFFLLCPCYKSENVPLEMLNVGKFVLTTWM